MAARFGSAKTIVSNLPDAGRAALRRDRLGLVFSAVST